MSFLELALTMAGVFVLVAAVVVVVVYAAVELLEHWRRDGRR